MGSLSCLFQRTCIIDNSLRGTSVGQESENMQKWHARRRDRTGNDRNPGHSKMEQGIPIRNHLGMPRDPYSPFLRSRLHFPTQSPHKGKDLNRKIGSTILLKERRVNSSLSHPSLRRLQLLLLLSSSAPSTMNIMSTEYEKYR